APSTTIARLACVPWSMARYSGGPFMKAGNVAHFRLRDPEASPASAVFGKWRACAASLHHLHRARQEERELRPVGHDGEEHQHRDEPWQHRLGELGDAQ